MSRLETLRRIAAQRPTDPFPRYGLAMELRQTGAHEEAVTEFAALERDVPDYVPQYLMHGQLLGQLGRADEARAVLLRGVTAAEKKGDGHALGELRSAIDAL